MSSSFIPFQSVADKIKNIGDDDFEPLFDESYGDPSFPDDDTKTGLSLVLMTLLFLFVLVILRYCCALFIDYVVLCELRNRRNNDEGFFRRTLSLCCPRYFPPNSAEGNRQDLEGGSNNANNLRDDGTATNTSTHSDSSDSDDDEEQGMELAERNSRYARRLVRILTVDQKRTLFASVLDTRTATEADILQGRKEEPHVPPSNENSATVAASAAAESIGVPDGVSQPTTSACCHGSECENTPSSAVELMDIPDGSPLPTAPTVYSQSLGDTACCPICIQDIKVGDKVCQSKRNNCRHLFHLDCILEWLGTGSTLCPYCRREIFTRAMLSDAYRNMQRQQLQPPKKMLGV